MANTTRRFEIVEPVNITDPVALSVGLYGFTGTGKTESALRLAFGIRRVTGGRVFLADCDNGRGLHFIRGPKALFPEAAYIDFRAPHNASDYSALLEQMSSEQGVLVIDNMSAEHDGEGGLLDTKEAAMYDRNGNYKEGRAAVAWNTAKTPHKAMVRTFVRVNRTLPIIVTWRAQEKLDWGAKNDRGQSEPKSQGEMPIGSRDLPFEMTATYLLPVGSRGEPCLTPKERGEQMMTKIPRWFDGIVRTGEKFREEHGEAMARWAFGSAGDPVSEMRAAFGKVRTSEDLALAGATWGERFPKEHPQRRAFLAAYKAAEERTRRPPTTPPSGPGSDAPPELREPGVD